MRLLIIVTLTLTALLAGSTSATPISSELLVQRYHPEEKHYHCKEKVHCSTGGNERQNRNDDADSADTFLKTDVGAAVESEVAQEKRQHRGKSKIREPHPTPGPKPHPPPCPKHKPHCHERISAKESVYTKRSDDQQGTIDTLLMKMEVISVAHQDMKAIEPIPQCLYKRPYCGTCPKGKYCDKVVSQEEVASKKEIEGDVDDMIRRDDQDVTSESSENLLLLSPPCPKTKPYCYKGAKGGGVHWKRGNEGAIETQSTHSKRNEEQQGEHVREHPSIDKQAPYTTLPVSASPPFRKKLPCPKGDPKCNAGSSLEYGKRRGNDEGPKVYLQNRRSNEEHDLSSTAYPSTKSSPILT